ncbi:ATP-binding protein [Acidianus sp. HS-5]|uniref:ATP-binding protein n=1 Tax=Acidianus sp. HS-5 TaxID=2886040 RepID=UPI001F38FAEB|nr:ATP-binding protein [Acidianus sp. HS-5]BDC17842.1 hypothetical protein HS5_07320 [Acidianus sp. HS-5]
MICNIPKVTVTTWNSNNVILVGPTYKQYLEKALNSIRNNDIASIIGQPGMGKTTILKKVQEDVKDALYMDLASKGEIEDEFWSKIDKGEISRKVLPKMDKKKYGYSFWKRLMGVKFEDWLHKLCGKYDDTLLKLYCLDYQKDFDGMIRAINDLKGIEHFSLLIDEVRENHIPKIHRLINAGLGIPVLMAIPTDVYSRISDLAIRRRLDESRISLDNALTSEDIKEIVDVYCHEISDDLLPIVISLWNGRELNTVSSILQFMKSEVEKFEKECSSSQNSIECVKEKLRESHSLKNPEEESKKLEKMIRDLLTSLTKEFQISYVHPRGKRVEVKGKYLTLGIFFIKDNNAYVGLVKLLNDDKNEDEEVKMLSLVEKVEHEKKEYAVEKRFIITNSQSLNVDPTIIKIELTTMEAIRILQGDTEILEEKLKEILTSFNAEEPSTAVVA